MTEQNFGCVWTIDLCYRLSKTNLSNQDDVSESTHWINLRPMFFSENNLKGSKIDHRLHLMQGVKAKFFSKFVEEEPNQTTP